MSGVPNQRRQEERAEKGVPDEAKAAEARVACWYEP